MIAECIDVVERRGTHRSGADDGEAARRAAAVFQEALGPAAAGAARADGDLSRDAESTLVAPHQRVRRRGAVRAGADLADLARHARADATRCGSSPPAPRIAPGNFVGRVGAFLSELSFQLFGYAAYPDSGRHRRRRLALLLVPDAGCGVHEGHRRRRCSSPASSAFLSLVFGSTRSRAARRSTPAARSARGSAASLSEYLNRTGSIIVLLTLMMLAVILSTQFSFGRMFASAVGRLAGPVRARRRLAARAGSSERRKEQARREVIAKHAQKAPPAVAGKPGRAPTPRTSRAPRPARPAEADGRHAGRPPGAAGRGAEAAPRRLLRCRWPNRAARRRHSGSTGAFTLPPPSLLDAPKAERKIDERELMDVGAAARGEVPRVRRRRPGRADSSRARSSRRSSSSRRPA